jgi:hypothetical protein
VKALRVSKIRLKEIAVGHAGNGFAPVVSTGRIRVTAAAFVGLV